MLTPLSANTALRDPLRSFKIFEIIIAVFCISMPLLLKITDLGYNGFRSSISDYVYMIHSYYFGMVLTIAAMLFIVNGAVFFKNEQLLGLDNAGKWYNIILGVSLLLVIILPHKEFPIAHYIITAIFFVGNIIVIAIFHKKQYTLISLILAGLTTSTIILHFLFQPVTLLVAEWLSLTIIGIHFILQATGAISFR